MNVFRVCRLGFAIFFDFRHIDEFFFPDFFVFRQFPLFSHSQRAFLQPLEQIPELSEVSIDQSALFCGPSEQCSIHKKNRAHYEGKPIKTKESIT